MMIGHVVEAAIHCTAANSTLSEAEASAKEIERLRAELVLGDARVNSLMWVLRIVRREVNWGSDSPTLRLIDQSIAGAESPGKAERRPAGVSILRSG